jgi:4-hydroxy-2-oxoheptanedioate aldolase
VVLVANGNDLRAKWNQGQATFGLWAGIDSSLTAEVAAAAGFDYVCVDLQHGMSDERTMVAMFQAIAGAGSVPLARLAWNEPWLIMRALDLGAGGVIVPLVGSGDEARRAVEACKYPPHGNRSYGPIRAQQVVGSSAPSDLADSVVCFAMIETSDGIDRLEQIAATPGLDGLYIGPADLALALGRTPGAGGELLDNAITRVRETCDEHGIIPGMHCDGGESARSFAARGFKLITVGVDSSLLKSTLARELAAATDQAHVPAPEAAL